MKKLFFLMVSLCFCSIISAQEIEDNNQLIPEQEYSNEELVTDRAIYSSGDLYQGLTRTVLYDRMIPPYGVEVTFDKTTTIVFPSSISSVNLGSANIIAGKYPGVNNVLRVQAAIRDFSVETNFSVITDEGSYYSFNVKYSDEPEKLNIELKDFTHDGEAINRPNNSLDIYLKELGNESPKLVRLIMKSIYDNDKRHVKHIGSKKFGIQFLLKGIYSYDNFLYLHTQVKNSTYIPYDVDFIRMKIVDKKVAKRTAIQETVIVPVRAFNYITCVNGKKTERTVFVIEKVTIPNGKQLVFDLYEQKGGRHQSFSIENEDLIRAEKINELKIN